MRTDGGKFAVLEMQRKTEDSQDQAMHAAQDDTVSEVQACELRESEVTSLARNASSALRSSIPS